MASPGAELRISEFDSYGARVGSNVALPQDSTPARARNSLWLLRDAGGAARAELSWRLGMVFAAFNLVLLALSISSVNPRVGRSGNLLFALFAFVIYYNLLNLGESWVGSGRYQAGEFMLALHGGALLAVLAWLAMRHNNWGPRPRRLRQPDDASSASDATSNAPSAATA